MTNSMYIKVHITDNLHLYQHEKCEAQIKRKNNPHQENLDE